MEDRFKLLAKWLLGATPQDCGSDAYRGHLENAISSAQADTLNKVGSMIEEIMEHDSQWILDNLVEKEDG